MFLGLLLLWLQILLSKHSKSISISKTVCEELNKCCSLLDPCVGKYSNMAPTCKHLRVFGAAPRAVCEFDTGRHREEEERECGWGFHQAFSALSFLSFLPVTFNSPKQVCTVYGLKKTKQLHSCLFRGCDTVSITICLTSLSSAYFC